MALIQKILIPLFKTNINETIRFISLYPRLQLKEISERQENSTLIIQGKIVASPRYPYLLKKLTDTTHNSCPVCSSGLDIKHTDVLILSQFVRNDGCMLPRRITGLCKKQQKRISTMVSMAQKAGLMSNLTPPTSKRDPKLRKQWKKFNTYFDENTIQC